MAQMPTLRDIVNDTPGDATDPEYNFNTIEDHLANEVVNRDGSVAMVAPLTGVPAVSDNQYATLGQVSNAVPVATIVDYAADAAPDGWQLCDGRSVSVTDPTYAALYAKIGDRFGSDGAGNFNLPDLRTRVIVGASQTDPDFALGTVGGTAVTELLEHTHDQTVHTHKQTAHNHSVSLSDGGHVHIARFAGSGHGSGIGGAGFIRPWNSTGIDGQVNVTDNDVGKHSHSGDTGDGSLQGATGPTDDGSTGGATDPTETTGDAAPDNYPPYVTLHKIIKL